MKRKASSKVNQFNIARPSVMKMTGGRNAVRGFSLTAKKKSGAWPSDAGGMSDSNKAARGPSNAQLKARKTGAWPSDAGGMSKSNRASRGPSNAQLKVVKRLKKMGNKLKRSMNVFK